MSSACLAAYAALVFMLSWCSRGLSEMSVTELQWSLDSDVVVLADFRAERAVILAPNPDAYHQIERSTMFFADLDWVGAGSTIDHLDTANSRSSRNATENDHLNRTLCAIPPAPDANESRLDPPEDEESQRHDQDAPTKSYGRV
jgi:hypothetical protein